MPLIDAKAVLAKACLREGDRMVAKVTEVGTTMAGYAASATIEDNPAI